MKCLNTNSFFRRVALAVLLVLLFQSTGSTQGNYRLEFLASAAGTFKWRAGFGAFMTTAPNGSTVFTGGGETFSSFEEFQDGVVGQWTVTDFLFNEATFVVSSFSEDLFAEDVELLNPMDGQDINSGLPINYEVASTEADFVGIGVAFSSDELDVDFESGQIMILTLLSGIDESFASVRGRGLNTIEGLISDIDDADVSFSVSGSIQFVGESVPAEVRVIRKSVIGDVNRDGSVDLLDVAPFVELLSNNDFQPEADVNQDGVVNLLDVAPFVDLLSGG